MMKISDIIDAIGGEIVARGCFVVDISVSKAVGSKVEVSLKGGKQMVALLSAADAESITLKYTAKEAVEGKKKKELVEHVDRYTMDQVNAVRPFIEFN